MDYSKIAVLIGNSDGIGKKVTELLLQQGYEVIGLSRSPLVIDDVKYRHQIQDVAGDDFKSALQKTVSSIPRFDLCIYFVGIGEALNLDGLEVETKVFQVNAMGALIATEVAISEMLKRGAGHFIGLSSVLDVATSSKAPSYCASKAAVSRYWEGLALSLSEKPVHLSNIRFGYVDTKMAKSPERPFMITSQKAAEFILDVVERPRIRATKPFFMGFVVWFQNISTRLRILSMS